MSETVSVPVQKKEKEPDLRVRKTRQAIRKAFEELMMETDYEKITVKELCARAMINRKTFYAHYAYLDLLLDEYVRELADTYLVDVGASCGLVNLPERIRSFFLYVDRVPPIAEKMVLSCRGLQFFECVSGHITEMDPCRVSGIDRADPAAQEIISEYLNHACMCIYKKWLTGGKKIPPQELAELSVVLICGGVKDLIAYIG